LEVKAYMLKFHENEIKTFFGTTRTFTFIGILGFIFYLLDPNYFSIFIVGFLAITFLYSILFKKLLENNKNSIILFLVSLIVYSFGPL
ncbi:beta-carotene 15,15'-monooxygenase, partial [Aliarcobacter butzleri]